MSQLLMNAGRKWIKDPTVILDLGARDCSESIQFALDYPSAHVFAFECNPESLVACRSRVANVSNITLVPLAVHEHSGQVTFFRVSARPPLGFSTNVGASSLFRATGHMVIEPIWQESCVVDCIRLDDWVRLCSVQAPSILWLDLQGAELLALRGLGDLIKHVEVIHTEVTYRELYAGQVMYSELDQWLVAHEFVQTYHEPAVTVPDWFGEAVYVHRRLVGSAHIEPN